MVIEAKEHEDFLGMAPSSGRRGHHIYFNYFGY